MFFIGGRAGVGRRLVPGVGSSSIVNSAISTNSKSKIRLTTFVGSVAAGLKGPLLVRGGDGPRDAPAVGPAEVSVAEAAAARRSRPEDPGWLGENNGSVANVEPVEEGGSVVSYHIVPYQGVASHAIMW